ncbi:MAG: Lrp/AsnC family transcriptional regulator, leucine-responsive regulatory protein [Clostridiales bacterium]|jgi:Lrp/AsnC family leucine-responsive transcriptional regulator|nr:Lrp/AsnC family transcriptional regulator, leucine-responsive regulatory protein [Clostridiales bacterium]MDN5299496.1 Lrp/AsnC family transcriptional regulator, leucine-responsive regulatory protein [Clostridiales bacterium]
MDATDLKIVNILQEDGRISMKELGNRVNLTSPAVSERVKRLEENGVIIGYTAIVDPTRMDLFVQALVHVGLKVSDHERFKKLAHDERNIVECHHVTGEECMTVKVICADTQELEMVLDKIQTIGSTKTSIILSSPLERKPILPKESSVTKNT